MNMNKPVPKPSHEASLLNDLITLVTESARWVAVTLCRADGKGDLCDLRALRIHGVLDADSTVKAKYILAQAALLMEGGGMIYVEETRDEVKLMLRGGH